MRFIFVIGLIIFLSGCIKNSPPPKSVDQAIEKMISSISKLDADLFMSLVQDNEDGVFLGTDESEVWIGKSQLQIAFIEQFSAWDSVTVDKNLLRSINYSPSGDAAWFTDISDFSVGVGGEIYTFPGLRLSGVFVYDNEWLLQTIHFSIGVEGQAVKY
jgi:hypothetical protein